MAADFSDKQVQSLIKLYETAEKDIIAKINVALVKGNNLDYLMGMRKNVASILGGLRQGSKDWCEAAIPQVYSFARQEVDKQIPGNPSFGAIHQQAAQVLAENAYGKMEDVCSFIGRRTDDIYRALALENLSGSVVGYDTWKNVAKQYRENLAENGITGFVDKAGHRWNMKDYTEMVARTTTMEAHLEGTKNRILEHGYDLVKVTTHIGSCKLCQPYEGKILSLTGKYRDYPSLADAKANGLFHPRCKHAYGLYVDLEAEIAAEKLKSKHSSLATPEEIEAVKEYTTGSYIGINKYLRTGQAINKEVVNEIISNIDAFIDKSKNIPAGKMLFRGTDLESVLKATGTDFINPNLKVTEDNVALLRSKLLGKVYEDKGYTSTSIAVLPHYVRNMEMRIITTEGVAGVDISKLSQVGIENEVLLKRGIKLKITDVKKEKGKFIVFCTT